MNASLSTHAQAAAEPGVPAAAIEAVGLTKTYQRKKAAPVRALDDVTLTVPRGSIFGLLGPNGAGKSTFINIFAGLTRKTSGGGSIWGIDIDRDPRQARAAIGVVPQELHIDPFFTPREALEVQAGLYGVPPAERRTDDILKAVGLADKAGAYTRTLSGGMKRRLLVAKALVHQPPVLVLDEPTAGVDIELRQQLWSYVRELHAGGVTIVLTTHYLEEAEELCDTIAIINHGKVIACEPTQKLLGSLDAKDLIIRVDHDLTAPPDSMAGMTVALSAPNTLRVSYQPSATPVERILDAVRAAGLGIVDLSTVESDLEDVFLRLTRPH
ncbi:MAG: ABC transporter ATP-binding protein [Alphaproteobacteria bacterium]